MMTTWLESIRDNTVVVKFGGNAMIDDALAQSFCADIITLQKAGVRVVVAHGGGPQISSELVARGIHSEFRGGLRVTTPEAISVVNDVLVRIGSDLTTLLNSAGGSSVALAGDDHGLFSARRASTRVDGETVDLELVGEIMSVTTAKVEAALDGGHVPVVSAIARDVETGVLLNVNADAAAGALAAALGANWLLLLTDVAGLYRDWPDRQSLISSVDTAELETLLPRLESGMIPKVAAALDAILGGVDRVAIVDGRTPHVLVSEPFGASGTVVTPAERTDHE